MTCYCEDCLSNNCCLIVGGWGRGSYAVGLWMSVLYRNQYSPIANGLKSCTGELKASGITTWLGGNLGSCICQVARKTVHAYPVSKASLAAQT